jgi:uncharacterized membrane protein
VADDSDSPITPREPSEDSTTAKNFERILEAAAPEFTRTLPRKKREEVARLLSVTVASVSIRSGPLPPSDELAAYGQLVPDGANRVMVMAEKQQDHRIEIEKVAIKSQHKQGERGQIFALIIAILALGGAVGVTLMGHDTAGSIIGGTTVVSLVATFITGRLSQRKDLAKKSGK